jgi:hypothetical protein
MSGRVILGAILGGIAMFVWGALSHIVLGFVDHSLKSIPDEAAVIATLESKIAQPGIYLYPGLPPGFEKLSKADQQAAFERIGEANKTRPHGIIVYAPPAGAVMSPSQLGRQLAGDIAAALVAAILLAITAPAGYPRRLLIVVLMGLFGGCLINLPYWNWYGFPGNFTAFSLLDEVLRATAGGLVLAAIVIKRPRAGFTIGK